MGVGSGREITQELVTAPGPLEVLLTALLDELGDAVVFLTVGVAEVLVVRLNGLQRVVLDAFWAATVPETETHATEIDGETSTGGAATIRIEPAGQPTTGSATS